MAGYLSENIYRNETNVYDTVANCTDCISLLSVSRFGHEVV